MEAWPSGNNADSLAGIVSHVMLMTSLFSFI
jgi:hypothetical protein